MVRVSAAVSLFTDRSSLKSGVAILLQSIKDPRRAVRLQAVQGLGEASQAARKAVPALVEALKDETVRVRRPTLWGPSGPKCFGCRPPSYTGAQGQRPFHPGGGRYCPVVHWKSRARRPAVPELIQTGEPLPQLHVCRGSWACTLLRWGQRQKERVPILVEIPEKGRVVS